MQILIGGTSSDYQFGPLAGPDTRIEVLPVQHQGGNTWHMTSGTARVSGSWSGDVETSDPRVLRTAESSDIEALLESHLDRFDAVFRRLSE